MRRGMHVMCNAEMDMVMDGVMWRSEFHHAIPVVSLQRLKVHLLIKRCVTALILCCLKRIVVHVKSFILMRKLCVLEWRLLRPFRTLNE